MTGKIAGTDEKENGDSLPISPISAFVIKDGFVGLGSFFGLRSGLSILFKYNVIRHIQGRKTASEAILGRSTSPGCRNTLIDEGRMGIQADSEHAPRPGRRRNFLFSRLLGIQEEQMGCWAIDAFGNDDAADWAYGLEECDDLSLVESTLDKVLAVGSDDYLESPFATDALAAIEVVARLQGNWGERNAYTETVDKWVEKTQLKPSERLVQKAHGVFERILSDQSELKELWQDTEELDAWRSSVEDLKSRVHA